MKNSIETAKKFAFYTFTFLAFGWSVLALGFHYDGLWLVSILTGLSVLLCLVWWACHYDKHAGWMVFMLAAVPVAVWFGSLQPRQDRDWAVETERGMFGDVDGDTVTLHDVRNFTWHDRETATHKWETREYDLNNLASVDMITSVWDNPDIAHLIVSFGFSDGEQIAFSVEIRKEQDETFSTLGGFFRKYEQILIASDEADIVKLRTNHRHEDVRHTQQNLARMRGENCFCLTSRWAIT